MVKMWVDSYSTVLGVDKLVENLLYLIIHAYFFYFYYMYLCNFY